MKWPNTVSLFLSYLYFLNSGFDTVFFLRKRYQSKVELVRVSRLVHRLFRMGFRSVWGASLWVALCAALLNSLVVLVGLSLAALAATFVG